MEGYFIDDAPKKCPNCQAALPDKARYCLQCGQKQTTGRIKLRTLLAEFFETVFNLESRFFLTLGALFIPGKLTEEFFKGRHQTYFRPIRLFFVMAVVHFAVIAFVVDNAIEESITKMKNGQYSRAFHLQFAEELDTVGMQVANHYVEDTAITRSMVDSLQSRITGRAQGTINLRFIDRVDGQLVFVEKEIDFEELLINPIAEVVEAKEVQSGVGRFTLGQILRVYRNLDKLVGFLISNLTWMILLMMPALALILKLLYIRRDFYFVEHLIFSFHYHAFAFLIASPAYLLINIWPGGIGFAFTLILIYLFIAMKRVYRQGIIKTGVKFMILNNLYGIVFVFFFIFMLLISALVF